MVTHVNLILNDCITSYLLLIFMTISLSLYPPPPFRNFFSNFPINQTNSHLFSCHKQMEICLQYTLLVSVLMFSPLCRLSPHTRNTSLICTLHNVWCNMVPHIPSICLNSTSMHFFPSCSSINT